MTGWRDIDEAPRDDTWLLLEGEFCGGDTSSTRVGRWNPTVIPVGSQWPTYEWEVVEQSYGEGWDETAKPEFNHYANGIPSGWLPLPAQGMSAGTAKTPQVVEAEGRQPGSRSECAQPSSGDTSND